MGLTFAHHITRVVTVATAVFLVVAQLLPKLVPGQTVALYSLHGVFMTLAFGLCITLGLNAYVTDYGPRLNRRFPNRSSRRLLHGALQMCGGFLASVGYLIHFTYLQSLGMSHIAADAGSATWKRAHVWLGIFTMIGLLLQTCVGAFSGESLHLSEHGICAHHAFINCQFYSTYACYIAILLACWPAGFYKFVVRDRDGRAILKWHGILGLFVWLGGVINIAIALYGWFYSYGQVWVAAVGWAGLAVSSIATIVTLFMDPSRAAAMDADGHGGGYGKYDDTLLGSVYDNGLPRGSMGTVNGQPLEVPHF